MLTAERRTETIRFFDVFRIVGDAPWLRRLFCYTGGMRFTTTNGTLSISRFAACDSPSLGRQFCGCFLHDPIKPHTQKPNKGGSNR